MIKTTIYVGLNDKETKVQKINILEAYKIAQNILTKKVDGATIYEASGIYKHENGAVVIEQTLRIEILNVSEQIIDELIKTLKIVFNQESVLVQNEDVNIRFV